MFLLLVLKHKVMRLQISGVVVKVKGKDEGPVLVVAFMS